MSDAIPLPPRPNLEQYKKLAKDFQRACQSGDSNAIRDAASRWLMRLHEGDATRQAERIEERWRKMGRTTCKLADAQLFIARMHGFASWPKFAKHIEGLARAGSPVSHFERAADAIVNGDIAALEKLLRAHPELVRQRSTRDHRSTLLHYVSANGIEDFRQKTPKNIAAITKVLLDAGADVNAASDAYGGGSTTLGLAATSIHPQKAGVQIALMQTLLDYGARLDQPLSSPPWQSVVRGCVANGQPDAAVFLVSRGAWVDLHSAVAIGLVDVVRPYFDQGAPPDAVMEEIKDAFGYTCGYGRIAMVEFLLEHALPYGLRDAISAMFWAAYGGRAEIVKLLLHRGWPIDVRHPRMQLTPLEVALRISERADDPIERQRALEVVRVLREAGA